MSNLPGFFIFYGLCSFESVILKLTLELKKLRRAIICVIQLAIL